MNTHRNITTEGKSEKRNLLIEKYYDANPCWHHIPFKKFEQICKTPFYHAKRRIASGKLYDIRYNHLGQFCPSVSSVVYMLSLTQKRFDTGNITENYYNSMMSILIEYIKSKPEDFIPYKDKIKQWISLY